MQDPALRRLGLARSSLGILITLMAGYLFHRDVSGISGGLKSAYYQIVILDPWTAYLFGGISLIIGTLALALRQRTGKRRHLLTPLYTYALAWVPFTPVIIAIIVLTHVHSLRSNNGLFVVLFVLFLLALPFLILWWLAFVAFCCFHLVRDMFRAADANPMLAPVLSTVVPLIVFVLGLIFPVPRGNSVPGWAQTLMAMCGVLSTGALSAIEIRRLRRDHGISTTSVPPVPEEQETPEEISPPHGTPPAQPAVSQPGE